MAEHIACAAACIHDNDIVDASYIFDTPRRNTVAAENDNDWAGDAQNAATDGEFTRDTSYIADRVVASVTAEQPQATNDETLHLSLIHI